MDKGGGAGPDVISRATIRDPSLDTDYHRSSISRRNTAASETSPTPIDPYPHPFDNIQTGQAPNPDYGHTQTNEEAAEWVEDLLGVAYKGALSKSSLLTGKIQNFTHWGQGVVYRTGTLQVHCKEMDNVPTIYLPSTLQVCSEFSGPISLQCPSPGHCQYIHSVPSHVTAMSPLGN